MISKIYYRLFSRYSSPRCLMYCLYMSKDKDDSTILLQNPQIIYSLSISKVEYDLNSSLLTSRNFVNANTQNVKANTNFSTRFEKKNKNSFLLDYDTSIKKNKIASRKKKHNKISLDQEDFFIGDSNTETEVNNLPIKLRKQKKKYKPKQQAPDSTPTNNIISTSNSNNNLQQNQYYSKEIILDTPLTVQQLASKLRVSEASIITWLFLQGISVTINQSVDVSIATKVAEHYGFSILNSISLQLSRSLVETSVITNVQKTVKRAPIITIFGHVDHGKTTLLDYIRKTNMVNKEAGGITQSINAYEVEYEYMNSTEKLIFLDTPGHAAFTSMRLRSAEVTDIALLLVAADDGLKPQTIEAIEHIISGNIPYLVAINKIDKEPTNIEKIKEQLKKEGISGKREGYDSTIFGISALTGFNVHFLLSNICKLSDSLNLRANLQDAAEGIIIEAYLDKKTGPIATVVIKNGTINLGDIIVAGNTYGRVKLIKTGEGIKVRSANSSSVVQICGFSSVPQTGLNFYVVDNEKKARHIVANNINSGGDNRGKNLLDMRVTLGDYNNNNQNIKKVNIILKADTQGSVEAILHAFSEIPQDKVQLNVILSGSGSVFDTDLNLALTSQSIILGFNISILSSVRNSAERLKVPMKNCNVIYDLLDYVKQYMLSLINPQYDKVLIGQAIVQTVFHMNKGTVAGCFVNTGIIRNGAYIIVYRNNVIVYEGTIISLKHLKDNVNEVTEGNECGIMCSNYTLWQELDSMEVFEIVQKEKIL